MRRYGVWGGQPEGKGEDRARCVAEVGGQSRYPDFRQCSFSRGHGPDGLYCKQHATKIAKNVRVSVPEDRPETKRVHEAKKAEDDAGMKLSNARGQLLSACNEKNLAEWREALSRSGQATEKLARALVWLRKEKALAQVAK